MLAYSETSTRQALSLFDQYLAESPEVFQQILEDNGWHKANVEGAASIYMQDASPVVFKLILKSEYWRGYDAFASRLCQSDIVPSEYPNLPHIYRYRTRIALIRRVESCSLEQSQEWHDIIMNMYNQLDQQKRPFDLENSLGEAQRAYPQLRAALVLIRDLVSNQKTGDRKYKFQTKVYDILKGDVGPVLLDPLH
jgi:hypothetical protein